MLLRMVVERSYCKGKFHISENDEFIMFFLNGSKNTADNMYELVTPNIRFASYETINAIVI